MSAGERKTKGRKAFEPTDDQRKTVRDMVGAPHGAIARVLGVSVPTLRKYFATELEARKGATLFEAPKTRRVASPGRGGRKRHEPSVETRRRAMELKAVGKTNAVIASALEISEPTLLRYYAAELELGPAKTEAALVDALMKQVRKGNVSAMKEVRAMIADAQAEKTSQEMTAAAERTPEGKKHRAQIQAAGVLQREGWGRLIGPAH